MTQTSTTPHGSKRSEDKNAILWIAALVLLAATAWAQNATDKCRLAQVIPLADGSEPAAKLFIDPPLPGDRSLPGEL